MPLELIHENVNNEKNNDGVNEHHHKVAGNHSCLPKPLKLLDRELT